MSASRAIPSRPVTFLFNGGPGSGSVWLHMGAFGPRRVAIPSDGTDDGAPPFPIVDNPDSLLDVTDIVFIDPVGTGFSHALGETDRNELLRRTKDAQSIAQFIRLLAQRERPLELAQISRRRELRHDPHRRGPQPARGRL